MQTRGKFKNSKTMKFLVLLLQALALSSLVVYEANAYTYCYGVGEEEKQCEFKRAQEFLGGNAKKVDDQVELISRIFRKAMLSLDYKELEPYIKFPLEFHVTDFRGTELRKDATGYDIPINNFQDLTKHLIELNTPYYNISDNLMESEYSKLYANDTYVNLITIGHNVTLKVNKDLSVCVDSILIKLF